MLNFAKRSDLHSLFQQMISKDYLVRSVFEDCPELDHFCFSCSSEYDDNNYSDHVSLQIVNGHKVDYNGRYPDDPDFDDYGYDENMHKSDLPRVSQAIVDNISYLVNEIGNDYGYSEEITISRDDMMSNKKKNNIDRAGLRYIKSYVSKEKIENEWFLKNPLKWACYYAEDHGRFDKELETLLFMKQGVMREAYMYVQATKKPLPKEIETFFVTHNLLGSEDTNDAVWLKEYLRLKDRLKKEKSKQN